jgi:hypothetical protein
MRQQHIPSDDDRLMSNKLFDLVLPRLNQLAIGGTSPLFSLLLVEPCGGV